MYPNENSSEWIDVNKTLCLHKGGYHGHRMGKTTHPQKELLVA